MTVPAAALRVEVDGFHVELADGLVLPRLDEQVRRLLDPSSAVRTLHWGRNYLYVVEIETGRGVLSAVVKQFRHTSFKDRVRRRQRGSKAERSWRTAKALFELGYRTPEPLLLVDSLALDGPSLYVSRFLEESLEARYLMRAMNADREGELYPEIDAGVFVDEIARLARRLHDDRVWYRDFTSGNVLLDLAAGTSSAPLPPLVLVDLNRARLGRRLSTSERMRDLARLPLHRRADQDRLLSSYAEAAPGAPVSRFLYRLYHHSFLLKNRSKQGARSRLRRIGDLLLPRRAAHAHIASPDPGAGRRDKVVWDPLSDQPHQHAKRLEKLAVRLVDGPAHLRGAAIAARALPRAVRRARVLRASFPVAPVRLDGFGVAVRPSPGRTQSLLDHLEFLGVRTVLLRLHPWADPAERSAEAELAAELHRRGLELVFALPQNRELVRDAGRWTAVVSEIAATFAAYGRHFQIGQAPNRSKWGIWTAGEYAEIFGRAADILRRRSENVLLGPAVIDFEPHATALYLNLPDPRLAFDVCSSLLYVDRRGAPENRQLGLDLLGKLALLKALVETAPNCRTKRCWVTEVNWPLREGPHAPAGRDVAVSEEEQASYLARYYLLALGSGLVERVYWWQLLARGYGLVEPTGSTERRRPAYWALAQVASLAGCAVDERLAAPQGVVLLALTKEDGSRLVAGWSLSPGEREVELPLPAVRVWGRDGDERSPPADRRVRLSGAPAYFELEPYGAAD